MNEVESCMIILESYPVRMFGFDRTFSWYGRLSLINWDIILYRTNHDNLQANP
jgi:hypothetical protein